MKRIFVTLLFFVMVNTIITQKLMAQVSAGEPAVTEKQQHKIVFQLTTDDTLAHKALMKQLNNITSVAPGTKIEVVCHGPGLGMLVIGKTIVQEKIQQMKMKGVEFVACEFSMSERNVPKEKIIREAGFVKAGIIEIVTKQEEGWSYIKSGF
ncbi:MAG: DsrE family protein [Chitinophagaceae bacterium]|nr:DsrE family protein [Chitinophagaceae bacterium]